ncbi:MAG: malectin domain-containing carbohydrate-binding protein [Candidatus Latescibacterota bacterium]|jgi:hypothetical protein
MSRTKTASILTAILLIWPASAAFAQSEQIPLPEPGPADGGGLTFSLIGEPEYFHRHRLEVVGVPEHRQYIYQSNWTGDMGVRVEGLDDGRYTIELDYTDLDLNAPELRYFDIYLNDELVKSGVNIFKEVGLRRVLSFSFDVEAIDGAIEYRHHRHVPEAILSVFTVLRIRDMDGNLVAEKSAWDMRPADWDVRGYLDKLYFGPIRPTPPEPPWKGTYKIHADEPEKLTAADVMGPDGIAYPNWTRVGIPGGIPEPEITASLLDFGATPNDEDDDSGAFQTAVDELRAAGGGVLYIPAGRYYLDHPVRISGDNLVVRGAGMDSTDLVSRFTMSGLDPMVDGVSEGGTVGRNSWIYVLVDPEGMTELTVTANGDTVRHLERPGLWEKTIDFPIRGALLLDSADPGEVNISATISYRDGTSRHTSRGIQLVDELLPDQTHHYLANISFGAAGAVGDRILLAADGKRGDMHLQLGDGHNLETGDRIRITAPAGDRWNAVHRNDHYGGNGYRSNIYEVESVDGNTVDIGEALRIEFPIIDGSFVQKIEPLVHAGIEDLTLEQPERAFLHGINLEWGWESWVRNVRVVKAGYKPLYMPHCKRCEVRDSEFDRAWYNSGGSAYIGWEHSFDSIMEGVTTYDMRHAPVVQWATSGCVIRKSVFHNSDAQWHAGWTNENLYEELVVESSQDGGSYGNGGWASGPEDAGHGPNGPRNVIYNNNITSSKVGLWMGGMNENWLIMYNRFVVGRGPAILAKAASFDHIIKGNVFVMMEPYPAAIYLGTQDTKGIELLNNRFFGPVDQLVEGPSLPAVDFDNRILKSGDINRPHPPVRSIYEWQQARKEVIQRKQRERVDD